MMEIIKNSESLIKFISYLGIAVILGLVIHYLSFWLFEHVVKRTKTSLDNSLITRSRSPLRLIIILMMVNLALPLFNLSSINLDLLKHIISLCFIGSISWLIIQMLSTVDDLIISQYRIDVTDNLRARKVRTQLKVFKRIVIIVIGIIAFASMLMTFEKVRQIGTSILASAGVIGIIVGVAAQRTIATFLAGIQIAVTQPIRIDDVLIVENEWGRVEEITLTYVVVKIWDLRRLVLPITYFIEKPFQNWTRVTSDMLGTVFLYVDYTVPVQAVREELHRILQESKLWDGKVFGLQVTNTTEHTIELRALMSASDASNAWDLRCDVREKLIGFVHNNYPEGLPKMRAEIRDFSKDQSKLFKG